MDTYQSEDTISIWDEESKKKVVLKNLKTGERYSFVLKHSFTVGRRKESCDLQITREDRYISGKHLGFFNDKGRIYVEDLHSKNGTRLNGRLLSARTRVHRGDVLKLGRSEFEVFI